MTSPNEAKKFIVYTEPSQYEPGHDAQTGEPLRYLTQRIVAITHTKEQGEVCRAGRAVSENDARRVLLLPHEVGTRIMNIMQKRGALNCHGFANCVSGNNKRRDSPAGSVIAGNEAEGLEVGQIGLIGSPTSGYRLHAPGEALHSVVGLGVDTDDVIQVDTLLGDPNIANRRELVSQYSRLTGAHDTALYYAPPPTTHSPYSGIKWE